MEPSRVALPKRGVRRRGQGLVELAVMTPILLLMLLGVLDLGRLFFSYIQITNGVREGAGFGAHLPAETARIKAKVIDHTTGLPISMSDVVVSCQPVACVALTNENKATATISVTATWTFSPIFGAALDRLVPDAGLDAMTLQTQNTMRVL